MRVNAERGVVDFAIFPQFGNPSLPKNTLVAAEGWASSIGVPACSIDHQTASQVVDGRVQVVSEGDTLAIGGVNCGVCAL